MKQGSVGQPFYFRMLNRETEEPIDLTDIKDPQLNMRLRGVISVKDMEIEDADGGILLYVLGEDDLHSRGILSMTPQITTADDVVCLGDTVRLRIKGMFD